MCDCYKEKDIAFNDNDKNIITFNNNINLKHCINRISFDDNANDLFKTYNFEREKKNNDYNDYNNNRK